MNLIALFYFLSCFAAFGLFAWDKHLAVYAKKRVPEWLLLLFAVFGAFGALSAMWLFRHKARKPKFYITVPILMVIHIVIFVLVALS